MAQSAWRSHRSAAGFQIVDFRVQISSCRFEIQAPFWGAMLSVSLEPEVLNLHSAVANPGFQGRFMLRSAFVLVILASTLAVPVAHSQSPSAAHQSVLNVDFMDTGVDPCTDFFTYTCGGWLKKNPIPPDKTSWGLSSKLADDNRVLLREILEEAATPAAQKDPVKQKIGDYYTACMDEKAIDAAGTVPLKAGLERIARMHS